MNQNGPIHRIAVLGNSLPRKCGIATFTTHLSEAVSAEFPALDCFVLAMNDPGKSHAYPERVRFELTEGDLASYRRAADFLNVNTVDLVSVQHEFGIFGGKAGSHVLVLLRELRMPIVTTLHTILAEPNHLQHGVMDELSALSERLVVMSAHGATLLQEVHGVPASKIDLIPHGIPDVPFESDSKDRLGVEGKSVILTFGLLSPDKGIEYVIDAMPAILERHPDTVYIVLGATHPHVKERDGETYRIMLENRAKKLGVDSSMIFHDRFVTQGELTEFLAAADMYITPYLTATADHLGNPGLRPRRGEGRDLDAVPVRARAPRRWARGPGTVERLWSDRPRGHRSSQRRCKAARHAQTSGCSRQQHAVACGGAALHGELRACSRRPDSSAAGFLPGENARQEAGRPARDEPRASAPHDR